MFKREIFDTLLQRIKSFPSLIQVLMGPRQVGKTTLARQLEESADLPYVYASADSAGLHESSWIKAQWDTARQQLQTHKAALLILDEVQKLPNWSAWIKKLWDEDRFANRNLNVILLGSAPWLMQKGLADSLAGRFEIIPIRHWTFSEMQQAFGFNLEQYIYFGGYPGAASFINDEARWKRYIIDSLAETALSRDILSMTRIDKPALLRQLFQLSCDYSGQILSYTKMLGQLDDAGNTTTLAHYLKLLEAAGLIVGLEKYSLGKINQRSSSPKLNVLNTALISAFLSSNFAETRNNPSLWGRLAESAVGAYVCNQAVGTNIEVRYWRAGGAEVDYVLVHGKKVTAIEVKSGYRKPALSGLNAFVKEYNPNKIITIGNHGLSFEEFLQTPINEL